MRKLRTWQAAWLALATILVATADAEPIAYEECQQNLLTGSALDACRAWPIPDGGCFPLTAPGTKLVTDNGEECRFQFWSFDGEFYTANDLPADICVEDTSASDEESSARSVAWYYCTKPCEGDCPPSEGNTLVGINASDSEMVAGRFIESVDPPAAIGNCNTNANFCRTSANISSATAEKSVGLLDFSSWLAGAPGDRTNANPGSPDVAFFRHNPEHPCGNRVTGPNCPPIDWETLMFPFEEQWVLVPRICLFVSSLEGCPGCGLEGQCAPWTFRFRTGAFEISLVDLASRETVARAKAVGDGLLELRFVARNAERPGEGFAFLFQPIEGRAKPGARVHVGVELEVGR